MTDQSVGLNSDQPITMPEEDLFGRWPFAKQIAQTIAGWIDASSLVMALFGEWGEGKTSVLNLIIHALKAENITVVRFNPWRFRDEDQMLRNFFHAIASALKTKLSDDPRKNKLSDMLEQYGDAFSVVPIGVLMGTHGVPLAGLGTLMRLLGKVLHKSDREI